MDPSLTLSTNRTRNEWVKMFYPDMPKGIAVGVIQEWRPGVWVLYRKTDDTAYNAERDAPMGLDAGTLKYLQSLAPAIQYVDFEAEGSAVMLRASVDEFPRWPAQVTLTSKNAARTRHFVPHGLWHAMPLYRQPNPLYWNVTHLQEDGTVMGRFVAKDRR